MYKTTHIQFKYKYQQKLIEIIGYVKCIQMYTNLF